jgi:glycosyltransferase involved in cell wall biosynthesis
VAQLFWDRVAALPDGRWWPALDHQHKRLQEMVDTLNTVSVLISPSSFAAEMYAQHGVQRQRLRVSRQGVSLLSCPLHVRSTAFRAGYFGQMKAHKGVDVVLDAWERLRGDTQRRLTFYGSDAGEPQYGEQLRQRLRTLTHVEWPGAIPGVGLWEALSHLDVVVVPSRWAENSPNVILEAQAMGVPVVGSRLGGIPELVTHGKNGLLVDPDSPAALADALQTLMDDVDLRRQMSYHAVPFRTIEEEIADITAAYEAACLSRPNTGGS